MSGGPPPRRRPPYWTVLALAGLLALPSGWATPVAVVLLAAGVLASSGRALARTRASRARVTPALGAVALGRDGTGAPVTLSPAQLSAHGFIVGASGSGKSTTLLRLLGTRIEQGLPVIALDLKGSPSFALALAGAAARAGRPFLLWTHEGPSTWNPLAHGNPTELKDKLISSERFTEPHYQKAAERYLQIALRVLAEVHPHRGPTLGEVVAVCDPRRLAAVSRSVPDPLRAHVQDYLANLGRDQLSAARGLGTRLAIMTESHTGRYLQPAAGLPEIDIPAALRGEAVVLFSLNSSTYGKLAAQLGTMVVQDLISATGRRLAAGATGAGGPGAGGQPAMVGIDEFSALDADQVLALFARGREAGVSVILATQEFADLERAAPGLYAQVAGNTAVKIIHRQDVPASARMASAMCGTELVPEDTRRFGPGTLIPRGTRRWVERPRVHPNEIMAQATGESVLINKVPAMDVRLVRVRREPPPRGSLPDSSRRPGADQRKSGPELG